MILNWRIPPQNLLSCIQKKFAMPKYIALLRGINVSGQKLIKMDALRAMFEAGGCTDVKTYIQSGNVAFAHPEGDAVALRKHIEAHLKASLGYAVPTLLRNRSQLETIVAGNPYSLDLPDFGKKVYVAFFENEPSPAAIQNIAPYVNEMERLVVKGGEGYLHYADGLGKAKLTNVIIERKLGMATLRNWNTVTTLLDMAQ
jgi:uncharacterized protein (DUF1697 family)